jgi:hypothetical protein
MGFTIANVYVPSFLTLGFESVLGKYHFHIVRKTASLELSEIRLDLILILSVVDFESYDHPRKVSCN